LNTVTCVTRSTARDIILLTLKNLMPDPTIPQPTQATPLPAPAAPPSMPTAAPVVVPAQAAVMKEVPMTVAPAPPTEPVTQQFAVAPEPTDPIAAAQLASKKSGLSSGSAEGNTATDDTATSDGPAPKPSVPPKMPPSGSHAPVGMIVATVIGMLVLSGLAVAVYVTSQSSL
jgi:hypothetical protein